MGDLIENAGMRKFTESTLLPVSLVIVLFTVVWMARGYTAQTDRNTEDIREMKLKQEGIGAMAMDMAVIRVKVERIEQRTRK